MVTRQSDGVPSYKSKHTVVFLCTSIPDYIEPPNLLPYLPDLNPLGCSSAAGISSEDDGRPSETSPEQLMGHDQPNTSCCPTVIGHSFSVNGHTQRHLH